MIVDLDIQVLDCFLVELEEYKSNWFQVIDTFGSIFAVMIQVNNKD